MNRLFLVRHAHCSKNTERRVGGVGGSLTPQGEAQCERLASFLLSNAICHTVRIVTDPTPQSRETASVLERFLGAEPAALDEGLAGIGLGVLAGLSPEDARKLHPAALQRLAAWDIGRLRIDELELPGGENPVGFFRRGLAALHRSILPDLARRDVVCVLTRSMLILLANVLRDGDVFNPVAYEAMRFENASTTHYAGMPLNLVFANRFDYLGDTMMPVEDKTVRSL